MKQYKLLKTMKKIRNTILVFLLLWVAFFAALIYLGGEAEASEAFLRYSVSAVKPYPQIKSISAGYQEPLGLFEIKYEFGIMHDTRTASAMGFGLVGIGIEPTYGPIYVYFFQSAGLVTGEDSYISGYFQFFEEAGVGFKGRNGTAVSFGARHISNAGLSYPNKGKDTINFQVRFPLW